MKDNNNFLVDYESIRRRYEGVGVMGNGKDSIFEYKNVVRVIKDIFLNKRGVEQVFNNVNSDFLEYKIQQLHKSLYYFQSPHNLGVEYLAIRTVSEKSQDLVVIYDFPEGFQSLDSFIKQKKARNEKIDSQQVSKMLRTIIETLFMDSRFSGEFLDVNMQNIFVNLSGQFKLSNFGIQLPSKFHQKLNNTNDRIYQSSFNRQNNIDAFIRSSLFQLGFLALIMLTQDNSNNYYSIDKTINLNMVQKKLQSIKQSIDSKLFSLIEGLLQREEDRLNIEDIITNDLLNSQYKYQQNVTNNNQCKYYSGFILNDQYTSIGDLQTLQSEQYRGGFENGKYNQEGILIKENEIIKGVFINGQIKEGVVVSNSKYLYIGEIDFNNQQIGKASGKGVKLSLLVNCDNYYYQQGEFKEGVLVKGHTYYQNGSYQEGYDSSVQQVQRINNVVKYKQVQTFKLANMDTVQLQQAVNQMRQKTYKLNNNSSYKEKEFRGEGLLFIHLVLLRDLQYTNDKQDQDNQDQEQAKVLQLRLSLQGAGDDNEQQQQQQQQQKQSISKRREIYYSKEVLCEGKKGVFKFRENIKVKVENQESSSDEFLKIELWEGVRARIGGNKVSLKELELFYKGGMWINKYVDMVDERDKSLKGQIYMQLQWRPFSLKNIDQLEPSYLLELNQNANPQLANHSNLQPNNTYNHSQQLQQHSQLIINFISGQALRPDKYLGITDSYIYCELKQDNQLIKVFHSQWIQNNSHPLWNHIAKIFINLKLQNKQPQHKYTLHISLYDYQLHHNELLGYSQISLDKAINAPDQQITINQSLSLPDSNHHPNIQIQLLYKSPKSISPTN